MTNHQNTEIMRLSDQFSRSIKGPAWPSPALLEILEGISAREARAARLNDSHSLWEILLHITAWIRITREAMEGKSIPEKVPEAEDWPAVPESTPENWEKNRAELMVEVAKLEMILGVAGDALLAETVPGRDYNYYILLHGLVQHNYYHSGQIILLKRA